MNAISSVPAAYRPRELGPSQRRWLEQKHPGIGRNRVVRTWSHKSWCNERCSAPLCECQTKEKPE